MRDPVRPGCLRIAYLAYRGNPRCGGQGVYSRHLTRELAALGHQVTVFSGPPYPELDAGVELVRVAELGPVPGAGPVSGAGARRVQVADRRPRVRRHVQRAAFRNRSPSPSRARRRLARRLGDFDLVHDNQSLGSGLLGMMADGWPVLATIHHPITVDRELELSHADGWKRRLTLKRWYGFVRMQARVARRLPRVVTVSGSSRRDIADQLGVDPARIAVVPVGVDDSVFRPMPGRVRVRGRIMTTASADVPMKGLVPLLEALAKVRTERPEAHLVVVGRLKDGSVIPGVLDRYGLNGAVRFLSGVTDQGVVDLYAEAELAVVPSLYEGFSLPAVEAMACGVPLVATTGGALPEVAGRSGVTALLVPPNDPGALAQAMLAALADEELCRRLGAAGRKRTIERFTWPVTARGTVEQYRELLGSRPGPASC